MSDQTAGSQYDDDEFEVVDTSGPAQAAKTVASFLIGEGPEKKAGDLTPDSILVEKKVLLKGEPKARRFLMSDQQDAEDYAKLEHRFKTTGEVSITKVKELISGVDYALFITWIEFKRPQEEIRADVETVLRQKKMDFLEKADRSRREELGEKPGAVGENEGVVDDGVRCLGITGKKRQCTNKRKPDTRYCGVHTPEEAEEPEPVAMDPPPPTHQPLGSTS